MDGVPIVTSKNSKQDPEGPEDPATGPEAADAVVVEAADPAPENDLDDAEMGAPDELAETPEPAQGDVAPAPAPKGRGAGASFVALLAGGVLAGAIGFALGRIDQTSGWIFGNAPDVGAENAQAIATLRAGQDEAQAQLAELRQSLAGQAATLAGLPEQFAPVSQLAQQGEALSGALNELEARLRDLENRPIPDIGATQDAVAAYEQQLAAMRAMLAEELARIEAVQAKALADQTSLQSQTRSAAFLAATARLAAQATAGADMREALQTLRDLNTTIPPELETHSGGVASQANLTARFPDVARATLDRAIELAAEQGQITGLQAFVQKQLGARSLAPRPGDDADAVLARAEAELNAGNLKAAIAEVRALQSLGVAPLDAWLGDAETHITVQQAIAALEPNSAE